MKTFEYNESKGTYSKILIVTFEIPFTDVIFEKGAYGVLSKSQNPLILGQWCPPKGQTLARFVMVPSIWLY